MFSSSSSLLQSPLQFEFVKHQNPLFLMEGSGLSFVDDLTPAKSFWDMKCRIIKLWKQSYRWDMILLDEKGSKIQCCVRNHLVPDFEKQLNEDECVILRKFGVGDQKDRLRVIDLDFKVNFLKCTKVTASNSFGGHPFSFNFVSFKEIADEIPFTALTVDVIGKVAYCGNLDIFKKDGKEFKRVNLELQDLDGFVMKCTLWASYAEELNSFVAINTSTEMVILIIQHARVKQWGGVNTVQNDMYATRLFINPDIDEANKLRKSLILKDGSSTSQTVLSSQTVYPLRNEFVVDTPRKNVDEILKVDQEMSCIVVATIKIIEEKNGWFYNACRVCQKKAVNKDDYLTYASEIPENFLNTPVDSWWCIKCTGIAKSLVPKFKLEFRVQDSTGSAAFVMFDSEVMKLLGLTATDIRERQMNSKNKDGIPVELDALKNREFAFKISVSKYNLVKKYDVYTVRKLTDDPEILAELQASEVCDQITPSQIDYAAVNAEDSSLVGFDSKDAGSCTDDSLAIDVVKDSGTSPSGKRAIHEQTTDDKGSTTRTTKRKLHPILEDQSC